MLIKKTVSHIKHSQKNRLILLFIGAGLLTGCVSTPQPKAKNLTPYFTEEVASQEIKLYKKSENNIGQIFISIYTQEHLPESIWVNDLPIATHHNGYIRLPLQPGDYILKSKSPDSKTHKLKFTIEKGERKYFGTGGDFADMVAGYPMKEKKGFYLNGGATAKMRGKKYIHHALLSPSTPRHKLLPEAMKTKVDSCLANNTYEICNPVKQEVPLAFIEPKSREKIVHLVATEEAKRKEEAMDNTLRATLSKDALRDHYMIKLSNALSNREFDKSLPIFEKLKGLDMPLDPDFNYFYGEALHETGKNTEALGAITGYIRNKGSQATYYQESLQLLNKIQSAM